jgi:hypothetical protein
VSHGGRPPAPPPADEGGAMDKDVIENDPLGDVREEKIWDWS